VRVQQARRATDRDDTHGFGPCRDAEQVEQVGVIVAGRERDGGDGILAERHGHPCRRLIQQRGDVRHDEAEREPRCQAYWSRSRS